MKKQRRNVENEVMYSRINSLVMTRWLLLYKNWEIICFFQMEMSISVLFWLKSVLALITSKASEEEKEGCAGWNAPVNLYTAIIFWRRPTRNHDLFFSVVFNRRAWKFWRKQLLFIVFVILSSMYHSNELRC